MKWVVRESAGNARGPPTPRHRSLIWCLNRDKAKALACLQQLDIKDALNRWQTEAEMKAGDTD